MPVVIGQEVEMNVDKRENCKGLQNLESYNLRKASSKHQSSTWQVPLTKNRRKRAKLVLLETSQASRWGSSGSKVRALGY